MPLRYDEFSKLHIIHSGDLVILQPLCLGEVLSQFVWDN